CQYPQMSTFVPYTTLFRSIHGFTGCPYEVSPLKAYLKEHTDWKVEVPVLTGHGDELDLVDVPYEVWLEDAEQAYERLANICDTIDRKSTRLNSSHVSISYA